MTLKNGFDGNMKKKSYLEVCALVQMIQNYMASRNLEIAHLMMWKSYSLNSI